VREYNYKKRSMKGDMQCLWKVASTSWRVCRDIVHNKIKRVLGTTENIGGEGNAENELCICVCVFVCAFVFVYVCVRS